MNTILEKLNGVFNKHSDKASSEYILNPKEHPENVETIQDNHEAELRTKEDELRKKQEFLEIELAELEHNKTAKIKKEKAKRKTLKEWYLILKLLFSQKFEKHKAIFGISVLLFVASVFLHAKSFEVFLGIFLPSTNPTILFIISCLFALAMEGLATSLYESYEDKLAYGIYFVSLAVIVGMGFYEYSKGTSVVISAWRTGLGSLALIGLFASHKAMRTKDFWESRKTFPQLPKVYRKEINSLLEKLVSEHKAGNVDYKLNFKDILKTYNLKSADFEKLLVRKGLRAKKYFHELPARRREKNRNRKAGVQNGN